jgi:hypothetical protein
MKHSRNEKCSCGSGRKYKKCCLAKQIELNNDKLLSPYRKTQEEIKADLDKINRDPPMFSIAERRYIESLKQSGRVIGKR